MIVIGVLRERFAQWPSVDSIDQMRYYLGKKGIPNVMIGQRTTNIYKGRQGTVETMLKEIPDATHLLFVDSDETVAKETAYHMYQTATRLDLPILSGVVYQRSEPFAPTIYKLSELDDFYHYAMADELKNWFEEHDIPHFKEPCILDLPDDISIWNVDEVGTGCLLISKEVFEEIPSPWFVGSGEVSGDMSTDILFCRLARRHGFEIYADLRVQCGHLMNYAVTAADFRKIKKWVRLDNDGKPIDE